LQSQEMGKKRTTGANWRENESSGPIMYIQKSHCGGSMASGKRTSAGISICKIFGPFKPRQSPTPKKKNKGKGEGNGRKTFFSGTNRFTEL